MSNEFDKSSINNELADSGRNTSKRAYATPELSVFGKIRTVVTAGSMAQPEMTAGQDSMEKA